MSPTRLSAAIVMLAAALLLAHGPIAQFAGYHAFAAITPLFGVPRAADVLSNFGYVLAAGWGVAALWRARAHWRTAPAGPAYLAFFIALMLTAAGSAWYHLAPDDDRLVWDRVPLALACAALLAAVRAETHAAATARRDLAALLAFACASVAWWRCTGDLRPYILLQGLPLLLLPAWLWLDRAPARARGLFAGAVALYLAAKAAELHDQAIYALLAGVSGHTLKHLLSAAAAACIACHVRAAET